MRTAKDTMTGQAGPVGETGPIGPPGPIVGPDEAKRILAYIEDYGPRAKAPGAFDAACDILQWAMNHETATHEQIESIKAALAVLEAAGKVEVVWAGDAPIINDNADFKRLFEAIISVLPAGSRE